MAPEKHIDDMAQQSTRPITIAGRSDIAKVIFLDGHSINYPSIASITSASSYSDTPSTFRSRSSSERRGRRHASSFSSTSSIRESISHMCMPSICDDDVTDPDSTMTAMACSTHGFNHPADTLDHVSIGEESSVPMMQDLWATESIYSPSSHDQDFLVAGADGGHLDTTRSFTSMDETLDDLFVANGGLETDDTFPDAYRYGAFLGPQSAPERTSWMGSQRSSSATISVTDTVQSSQNPVDFTPPLLSKPIRKPGRPRGSKLPEEKRQKVAIMRKVGACKYCRDGRRACDAGTPCLACIARFGPAVLEKPNQCRNDIVDQFCTQILSKANKWHPHPREMSSFFGRDCFVTDWRYEIPIKFGFGPYLACPVVIVTTSEAAHLQHRHVVYPTPHATRPEPSHDYVLPVTFQDSSKLFQTIDSHLSKLVDDHFHSFSICNSHFRILDKIWMLYSHFRQTNEEYATLLHQALKLLVLVHDTEISVPVEDATVQGILGHCAPGYVRSQRITPCLLRAELGKVTPQLADILLRDVLNRLLRICLARLCHQHPVVIASFSVLMMVIESIMYHSSRVGYHAHTSLPGPGTCSPMLSATDRDASNPFQSITNPVEAYEALKKLEAAAGQLQTIYRHCFENCHNMLLRIIEERHYAGLQKQFGDAQARFMAALNQAIRDSGGFLERRVSEKVDGLSDSTALFDRLLARLFLLQTGPY